MGRNGGGGTGSHSRALEFPTRAVILGSVVNSKIWTCFILARLDTRANQTQGTDAPCKKGDAERLQNHVMA